MAHSFSELRSKMALERRTRNAAEAARILADGVDHLDPFLLLDHFESLEPAEYEAGFPYHPHRGIETVTIIRKGEVRHGDSLGHRGAIGAGDIQWMTSGSGILHEEMPQVRPEGIAGLQLWLNLPAAEKMSRPKYRDLGADRLAEVETPEGARIRVIAGKAAGGADRGPRRGPRRGAEVRGCDASAGGRLPRDDSGGSYGVRVPGPRRCALRTGADPGARAGPRGVW